MSWLCFFLVAAQLSVFQSSIETPPQQIFQHPWNQNHWIPLQDLALVRVVHWNFEGEECAGELLIHRELAEDIVAIFAELYAAHYPIHQMQLIDAYEGDDTRSMEANNSSAFCHRCATHKPYLPSLHALGMAIDINPLQNPYIGGETILPVQGEKFVDREQAIPGMICEGDPCYTAFTKRGFVWGGHSASFKDYQHFEKVVEFP